jgi:hypothetical protein
MLTDLWIKHRDWVFEPIYYSSLDALVEALDEKIIRPAEVRFAELSGRKAERMKGEHIGPAQPSEHLPASVPRITLAFYVGVWFGETVVDWLLVAVMLAWLMMASGVIPAVI